MLTKIDHIDTSIRTYLAHTGEIFAIFDRQDSNCVSYGIDIDGQLWFVKESAHPRTVNSLHRAKYLHSKIQHPAIARLHNTFRTPSNGLALVYEWLPGEIIYNLPDFPHQAGRQHSLSPHARFRTLPTQKIIAALNTIYDLHRVLAAAGFIAVDFYDGAILYDFSGGNTYVVDLDEYEPGPFNNPKGRLFGSSRFMAPEEFQKGARIDQITNVFTLGRTAVVLLANGDIRNWPVNEATKVVIEKATIPDRAARYPSVDAFVRSWQTALAGG